MPQQFLYMGWIISFILSGASMLAFLVNITLSVVTRSADIFGFSLIGWFLFFGLLGLAFLSAWGIRKDWQTDL